MQRLVFCFLFFCSFQLTAADTVLKLYRPFGESIDQAKPVIKHVVDGTCLGQSKLILREDAWRCQAQGATYDPCFVEGSGKKTDLLCPQSPWIDESTQIHLNNPLPDITLSPLDMSEALPWSIELNNGETCQAIDTKELFDGMPIRYRCSNDNYLVGHLQRCRAVWSMLEKTSKGVVTVDLKKVWF